MAEAIVRHRKVGGKRRADSDIAEMIQVEMEGEGEGKGEVYESRNKRVLVIDDFVYNPEGMTDAETKALLEKYDKNELPEKIIPKWRLFLDQFRVGDTAHESCDAVPFMHAPATSATRATKPLAKAFSDISAMVAGTGGIDVPYNARMLPYDAGGLDALPERDQPVLRDAIINATVRTGRMNTKSEIATMMAQGQIDQGAGTTRTPRKRQVSNADIITKLRYAPQLGYDDLRCVCVCFFSLVSLFRSLGLCCVGALSHYAFSS